MKYISSKQIEKYHKDGFLHVKRIFTEKECYNLKKILRQEINKGKEIYKKFKRKNKKETTYNENNPLSFSLNQNFIFTRLSVALYSFISIL